MEPAFMLIASPDAPLRARRSVILVAVHGEGGSLGFVLNRPLSLPLEESLASLGIRAPGARGKTCRGGTTGPDGAWLLFDGEDAPEDSCQLGPNVHVTASAEATETLLTRCVAPRALLCRGHRAWEAGELNGEIEAGIWFVAPLDPQVIFDAPFERRWQHALCGALGVNAPWLGNFRIASA
ncbi:MAG: YqgE/AlgH family protein [Myxococcota bacterium]